jgi:hypothetical protein
MPIGADWKRPIARDVSINDYVWLAQRVFENRLIVDREPESLGSDETGNS